MSEASHIHAKRSGEKKSNIPSKKNINVNNFTKSPIDNIMFLQETVGNQAVQRLIRSGVLQAKLRIGQPGDKYEQEADRVAEAVMRMPDPEVRRRVEPEEEEEEMLQAKPLTEEITPLVQRQVEPEEEEEEMLQAKPLAEEITPLVQRQVEPEEEKEEMLQAKPFTEEITPLVQRQVEPEEEEEEMLQAKPLTEEITPLVQRQVEPEKEEEEELQTKTTSDHHSEVDPNLESYIQSLKGGGQPLSENDRAFFEPRFGRDFSRVRVHTDAEAVESARAVNARAYTVGRDVVFGAEQYAPEASDGRRLMAHELAHVVQQRATESWIQRQKTTPRDRSSTSDTTIKFLIFELKTHAQLVAASQIALEELQNDLKGVDKYAEVRERASDWIAWIKWWQPYLMKQGDKPLTPDVAKKVRTYLDLYVTILREIEDEKKTEKKVAVKRELQKAQKQAKAAAIEAKRLRSALDDQLRVAYRTGKESRINEIANIIGTATDVGMGLHDLSRDIAKSIGKVAGIELPLVSKLTEALGHFNKALAAINLFLIVTDSEKKATELEESMRQINSASEAFTTLATLAGLAPHIGLYANLYLVPMTKVIMAQISHIVDILHEENKKWVKLGGEIMYKSVEPGPPEMFKFMEHVMHAAGPNEIPLITPSIRKYLLESREKLEAGSKEEVPTTGWCFWRALDTKKARDWIFVHRRSLWAMFYGSLEVPQTKGKSR